MSPKTRPETISARCKEKSNVVAYICMIKDILKPLSILSLKHQSNEMTLSEVPTCLESAFKDRYVLIMQCDNWYLPYLSLFIYQ